MSYQSGKMVRRIRAAATVTLKLSALACLSTASLGIVAVNADASTMYASAPAIPHVQVQVHRPMARSTGQTCPINIVNLVQQCTKVSGSGLHINSLSGWAEHLSYDITDYPSVHIELYGPDGHIKNCPSIDDFPPGYVTLTCTWSPNANEEPGSYCSQTWSLIGTTYKRLAWACIDVHK